jgi:hypothetical protein
MRKLAVLNKSHLCRYFYMDPDYDGIRIDSDSSSGFGSRKAKMTIKKGTKMKNFCASRLSGGLNTRKNERK